MSSATGTSKVRHYSGSYGQVVPGTNLRFVLREPFKPGLTDRIAESSLSILSTGINSSKF